jgi:tetratricopeptide (TPR) repeat protein
MASPQTAGKWIVRDGDGKIFGPFSTDQVLAEIDRGSFQGSEQIATYPGGEWIAISRSPEFYDRLLDVLASETADIEREKGSTSKKGPKPGDTPVFDPEKTDIGVSISPPVEKTQVAMSNTRSELMPPPAQRTRSLSNGPIIELTDLKSLEEKERSHSGIPVIPIALVGLAIGLLAYAFNPFQFTSKSSDGARIHLLAPGKPRVEMEPEKIKDRYRRALAGFQSDTFSGYQAAQNLLVEMVEGAPAQAEAMATKAEWLSMLCLTYRELWPYAYQDSADTRTVSLVMQEAKRLDPGGKNGSICEIVESLIANRYSEAQSLTENVLTEDAHAPMLFEMRGDIFMSTRDFENAATYFNQARTLWPAWQKPWISEARANAELKRWPEAFQLYSKVIAADPQHTNPVAKIELGWLEGFEFNHPDTALSLFRAALDGKERMPRIDESKGYLGVAILLEARGQKKQALEAARKATKLNVANLEAKRMTERLSGSVAAPSDKPEAAELCYLGDQYVRAGDNFSAQAQFKTCFEADPKNGSAAMRAGKALWELNQSTEAIDWMKKAIFADANLIPAYVELADYYAQRFDFPAASQILGKARQLQPSSYEVYRGLATVELRRNNFQGAIAYGQKALKLYGSDLQTYLIVAKGQLGLKNYQEAQKLLARAIELDYGSTEAQGLYGKAEAGLHGIDAGAKYLQQQLAKYVVQKGQQTPPAAIDLRLALSDIFVQDQRFKDAEGALREVLSLEKDNKKALVGLGKVLQAEGQRSLALESYLKAAVLDPSDADPLYFSGQLYLEDQKFSEAERQYQRVLKINPRYPRGHTQLGNVYLGQGNLQKAIDEAMLERDANPELVDSYTLAAEAQFKLKQYSKCAGEYQQAAKRNRNSRMFVKMARCYRLSGALDSATSLLNQAQSMESGNPDVYKEQGAIFHLKGMAAEAVKAYDTYLKLEPNAPDRAEIESRIQRVNNGDLTVGE